jgi:hypothetical protein
MKLRLAVVLTLCFNSAGFGEILPQDLNGLPGPRVGQFGTRFRF